MTWRSGLGVGIVGLGTLTLGCGEAAPPSAVSKLADATEWGHVESALKASVAAKPPHTITLYNHKPKLWSGAVAATDQSDGNAPPECQDVPCDHVRLKLKLPPGTFGRPNRPGGVQVALRWFGTNPGHQLPPDVPGCCGEFDTLNLWVYKGDTLVASSAGIIAVSQSALIPEPSNGTYDVWIAYDPSYNLAPEIAYEALAEVEYQPHIRPRRRVLPDLAFRNTERITFETPSFSIFEVDPPPGATCFDSEREEAGAEVCLRFDQIIANEGPGPLEIEHVVPAGAAVTQGDEFPVSQRVFRTDGTFRDRDAGSVEFHGTHGHFHYSSFANSELWLSNEFGQILGNSPLREQQKVSFCMADIRIDRWAKKGDGPRTYGAPDCLFPVSSDAVGDHYRQGIKNGWADIYDWYIPDQYIEVKGIADGYYVLKFCADPQNEIREGDESNNCLANWIHLSKVDTEQRAVTMLGGVPLQSK